MTQWEYRRESANPGQELEVLERLGLEGWELVSMLPVTQRNDIPRIQEAGQLQVAQQYQQLLLLMLKRPLSQETATVGSCCLDHAG